MIYSDLLSDEQLKLISEYPGVGVQECPIQKIYLRSILKRKIRNQGLADEVIEEVKLTKDSAIHEFILDHPDLTLDHVNWLKECGLTKRVRNIAKQLSNSKKRWN